MATILLFVSRWGRRPATPSFLPAGDRDPGGGRYGLAPPPREPRPLRGADARYPDRRSAGRHPRSLRASRAMARRPPSRTPRRLVHTRDRGAPRGSRRQPGRRTTLWGCRRGRRAPVALRVRPFPPGW